MSEIGRDEYLQLTQGRNVSIRVHGHVCRATVEDGFVYGIGIEYGGNHQHKITLNTEGMGIETENVQAGYPLWAWGRDDDSGLSPDILELWRNTKGGIIELYYKRE